LATSGTFVAIMTGLSKATPPDRRGRDGHRDRRW
jgi:hypothetical protein